MLRIQGAVLKQENINKKNYDHKKKLTIKKT